MIWQQRNNRRIFAHKPSYAGVVVPRAVVVEAGFFVKFLAGELFWRARAGSAVNLRARFAERKVIELLRGGAEGSRRAGAGGDDGGCAEMVRVREVQSRRSAIIFKDQDSLLTSMADSQGILSSQEGYLEIQEMPSLVPHQ